MINGGMIVQTCDNSTESGGMVEERELMARIVGGDAAAFSQLYDRFGPITYAFALQLLRDPVQAQDVVQDTFLTCWRQASRFDVRRGSVRTWLLSLVHHRAVDLLRSARHHCEHRVDVESLDWIADKADVEGEVVRRAEVRRTRAALLSLPPEQRQVVELAYFDGYRYPEIAALLDIPLGTVKSRVRLALARLSQVCRASNSAHYRPFAG